jgi:hypothetical protein
MDYIKMKDRLKKILLIILSIAVVLLLFFVFKNLLETKTTQSRIRPKKPLWKLHHHAELLSNSNKRDPLVSSIDEDSKNRAIKILSNQTLDNTVIFLCNAISYHNVYGYKHHIVFVDECKKVNEVAFVKYMEDTNDLSEQSILIPNSYVYVYNDDGWFSSSLVLKPSEDINEPYIKDVNNLEPSYLFLEKQIYKDAISGKGYILLIDQDGNVINSLKIKVL